MPNCYSRLADLKAALQGSGSGTSNDAALLQELERVSRAWDSMLGRHFYSLVATRYLPERIDRDVYGNELILPEDLIEVDTLKIDADGDGTYETTLAVDTDYWLYPYNRLAHHPARRIDINPSSSVGAWPALVRRVQLVGMFGWSNETHAAGTIAEALDAAETLIELTPGHDLDAGDTLVCEDEQMDVREVDVGIATVTRGVNGTTAATHADDTAISRRRFPRDIEAATVMQAARFFREMQTGYGGSVANSDLSGYSFTHLYPAIQDLLQPFRRNRSRAV